MRASELEDSEEKIKIEDEEMRNDEQYQMQSDNCTWIAIQIFQPITLNRSFSTDNVAHDGEMRKRGGKKREYYGGAQI
jgi:hypothetical protein